MKQFFKFVLATIVGIIFFNHNFSCFLGIIASAGSDKEVDVDANSVLTYH
jgi:protease-4